MKVGKRKPNNQWLAQRQAERAARDAEKWRVNAQLFMDSSVIAANRIFQRKGQKILDFIAETNSIYSQIAVMLIDDADNDEEMVYTKTKVDNELRSIVGDENFHPWDERYAP